MTCDPASGDELLRSLLDEMAQEPEAARWQGRQDLGLLASLHRLWLERGAELPLTGATATIAEPDQVMRAMATLPPEQREAVALVVVDEFDYPDAADVIGISLETLSDRLVAGRAALARLLA